MSSHTEGLASNYYDNNFVCVCVCVCACPSYEEMLEYYYKKRSYLMQDATRNSFHMSEYNTHDPIYLI